MTTKQKNIRDYIVGLCIIGVLIVAVVVQGKSSKSAGDGEEETTRTSNYVVLEGNTITDMEVDDFKKVTYTLKDKEPVVFEKNGEEWVVNGDTEFPMSADSFENQFLQKYIDGEVYDVVEGYENIGDYGLDEPKTTIEVIDNDGNTRTYLVGAYNGIIAAYYMYYKEEDVLYTASSDFLYICREDIYDFAAVDNFPSFSTSNLDYMVMNNGEKRVELVYMEDGYETDPFDTSTWYIDSPFNFYRACDMQDITENFEEVFYGLGFNGKADYYATDEELESYGLKNSDRYYEIVYRFSEETEATTGKITVKVIFGNYVEEKDAYYARVVLTQGLDVDVERSRSINYIDRASADSILNLDPVDYIYPYVLYVPIKEFANSGITVTKGDGTVLDVKYNVTYSEENTAIPETESFFLNDKEVDVDAFKDFYYYLTKIYVNRPIYAQDEIVDCEPTYTVTYDRIEEDFFGDAVVEYRVFDSTYYQVTINGYVDALAVRRDVDKAMTMLEELQE